MRKGISPLVATVLLIAFTIAVAGIISGWLTKFSVTTTETVDKESSSRLLCLQGGIKLSNLNYCNAYMSGIIENTEKLGLGEITLQIVYANATFAAFPLCSTGGSVFNCTTANLSITSYGAAGFNISSVSSNYKTIKVITNCSSVYYEAKSSAVISC